MTVNTAPKFSGEPTAQALAGGLATLGRYGDNYMVHAAEGETIVPQEILAANPGLKNDLFRQMQMMGIKDPNRYVVGNDLNSINPITGQPEFFFKKVFSAVKRVFKRALPVIAPIVGNLIAPGIGGPIASGLVTKLQGGSWGDVLKSTAMSYGMQALGQGVMGAMSSPTGSGIAGAASGFTKGLTSGITAPFEAAGNLFSGGPLNPFAQGIFGSGAVTSLLPAYNPNAAAGGAAAGTAAAGDGTGVANAFQAAVDKSGIGATTAAANIPGDNLMNAVKAAVDKSGVGATAAGGEGLLDQGVKFIKDNPLTVAATAAGMGFFAGGEEAPSEAERQKWTNAQRGAYEEWLTITDKHSPEARALLKLWKGPPTYSGAKLADITGIDEDAAINYYDHYGYAPAARGGEVVGRGTGTSDSIPARLSDGEFVMTAQAVRNAGGGDRNLGAARMYDMMNRFEHGRA
jgi:hypothetical protein